MADNLNDKIIEQVIDLLKIDLQRISITAIEKNYIAALIKSAYRNISQYGITLNLDSEDDIITLVMYTSYLYRKRASNDGMPRMLSLRLNERLFHEKMKSEETDG